MPQYHSLREEGRERDLGREVRRWMRWERETEREGMSTLRHCNNNYGCNEQFQLNIVLCRSHSPTFFCHTYRIQRDRHTHDLTMLPLSRAFIFSFRFFLRNCPVLRSNKAIRTSLMHIDKCTCILCALRQTCLQK